ncbi:MAG: hypothetical protein P4L63_00475 [Candidatus Pacebacteria bacterium]|nr:hypothetical protein [Candidatus Paceibacterota bacterium]
MEADNKKNEIKPNTNSVHEPPHGVVETFAGDMADIMGGDTEGLVKKIIHGEQDKEAEKKNLSPQSRKNKAYMFMGFLLLVLAVSLSVFFFSKRKTTDTVAVQPQFTPLIFTDQNTSFEISGMKKEQIAQTVFNEVASTTVQPDGVEGIYLTENKQLIGLRRFITLIGSHLSLVNDTDFVSDNFLLGVVKNQNNADVNSGTGLFILMKVRSATDIFDSLRSWEPNIVNDLHGFLGINLSSTTQYLFTKSFQDGVVENKNARILYDQNGSIVLMYIFADDNSVVITDSLPAAQEIILRLASVQPQQ